MLLSKVFNMSKKCKGLLWIKIVGSYLLQLSISLTILKLTTFLAPFQANSTKMHPSLALSHFINNSIGGWFNKNYHLPVED
jgi:hypothetical protein